MSCLRPLGERQVNVGCPSGPATGSTGSSLLTVWEPAQYLGFAAPRLRPATELLARIRVENAGSVIDLGCGPGNTTGLLMRRWPRALVTGVDSSPEMLARAAEETPSATFVEADLTDWSPPAAVDVVFANAVLHWVSGHDRLVPRLMDWLQPGGALAIQVPRNFAEPSHTLANDLALRDPFSERLGSLVGLAGAAEPATYLDWLTPLSATVDVWETIYLQVLDGKDPIVEWMRGAYLRPWLAALGSDAGSFLDAYAELMRTAYPTRDDGTTVFPYRRLFIIATREGPT